MRSGPPPDPNALRRSRDGKDWVKLPAAGRGADAEVPAWPLSDDPAEVAEVAWREELVEELRAEWAAAEDGRTARALARRLEAATLEVRMLKARLDARAQQEGELWARLWAMPQALVWEADSSHLQVAMYVRAFLEASRPNAKAATRALARQYADALLLTIPALHAMRYVIDKPIAGAAAADLTGEEAAKPAAASASPSQGRSRFHVVKDEGQSA